MSNPPDGLGGGPGAVGGDAHGGGRPPPSLFATTIITVGAAAAVPLNDPTLAGNSQPSALAAGPMLSMKPQDDPSQLLPPTNPMLPPSPYPHRQLSTDQSHSKISTNTSSSRSIRLSKEEVEADLIENASEQRGAKFARFQRTCHNLVENGWTTVFTTILTVFALFGKDTFVATTSVSADKIFDGLTITCLVVFSIEMVLLAIGSPTYFFSFFFFLDFISTVSLLFDISSVSDAFNSYIEGGSIIDDANAYRASRAGRAGSRAGRLVRIIRVIRLIRIGKLYKYAQQVNVKQATIPQQHHPSGHVAGLSKQSSIKAANSLQPQSLSHSSSGLDRQSNKRQDRKMSFPEPGEEIDVELAEAPAIEEVEEEDGAAFDPQTRVGKKLADKITKKVILMVLVMMFGFSILSPEFHLAKYPESIDFGIELVDLLADSVGTDAYDQAALKFFYYHTTQVKNDTAYANVCPIFTRLPIPISRSSVDGFILDLREAADLSDVTVGDPPTPIEDFLHRLADPEIHTTGVFLNPVYDSLDHLRMAERDNRTLSVDVESGETLGVVTVDIREWAKFEAEMSILQTLFICIVLTLSALLFSRDANQLVLRPIEKMVERVSVIRVNPLAAMRLEEELLWAEVNAQLKKEKKKEKKNGAGPKKRHSNLAHSRSEATTLEGSIAQIGRADKTLCHDLTQCLSTMRRTTEEEMPMETRILEQTIVKIGTLMALGFGEAGANVIAKNLESSEGVNPMVPGCKLTAIFGFCDIRNFTDATEVLKEKVMVFVNSIAEIVHGVVDDFSGSANKNIGDAFLMVWKFPEVHPYTKEPVAYKISDDGASREIDDAAVVTRSAELALTSYLKIIAKMTKSPIIDEYRRHPQLRARMGEKYRVSMGFGLHVGWAIEGAIGSVFKIDASYLSPNVNMSSRLEAATKQFRVPILVSGKLIELLSPQYREEARQIDCVTVKGSNEPLDLWTVDLNIDSLKVTGPPAHDGTTAGGADKPSGALLALNRLSLKKKKRAYKRQLWNPDFNVFTLFQTDNDIRMMRKHIPHDFLKSYRAAYEAYRRGRWREAKDAFER
eukprot:GHVT01096819.1.p1 GENE.GHVT01096819.1~~GHVT01096819.1.p1  ORF type:complete len:1066 (+),score=214.22 GHVT01096819.1:332-3529(+)